LSTARPSTPFDGQVIYETDTNRVLVWDNSAWVMIADTDSPPGLQLIKTQTIGSAVASVVVSDVFSSEFDNYLISMSGGVGSTSASVKMTLGSTTANYYQGALRLLFDASSVRDDINNGASWIPALMTANTLDAYVVLYSPFLTKRTSLTFQSNLTLAANNGFTVSGGGFLNNDTSYTAFTFTPSSGTMTGGTIRVYGYRNS
jgi:hypothetical protein